MGSVWRGVHRDSGLPVAVKVLHKSALRDGKGIQGFRNEVRAVAGLDHPGVVWVFDVGSVPPAAAAGSGGMLEEGAPYLAMEYASGGTLAEFVPASWNEAQTLLLELLSILGHAHARGVVHRDLKPGNVILGTSADVRPGWKLTDFGIAATMEETVERSIARGLVGTLAYMAPEQIRGDWRDYGPWTDLYALGCIVYRILGNQRPFRETRGPALITAHLTQKPQELAPRVPVPALFAQWVDILMLKAPRDRFQSAAEAARVLQSLGPPVRPLPSLIGEPTGPTLPPSSEDPTELARHRVVRDPRRVLPLAWRDRDAPWPPPRLIGAGLGLLGLRSVPMVGRTAERDLLWETLLGVLGQGTARVLVVRGAVGVGKSRLARWLGEVAHGLGGLPFLVGEARADEPPQEALARPFRRWFRTVRLPLEERQARLATALQLQPEDELVRLATAMLGQEGETGPSLEGEARHSVARRLLEHITAPARPAVILLDDAHHSHDTLRFARHLLEAQAVRPFPVVVVLTVSEEAAAAEASLYHELATLLSTRGVHSLSLAPLPTADQAALVQNLLPLEATLAALLVERTSGNPLHASELVKDWAAHGRLVRGAGGYELSGPLASVPPDGRGVAQPRRPRGRRARPQRHGPARAGRRARVTGRRRRLAARVRRPQGHVRRRRPRPVRARTRDPAQRAPRAAPRRPPGRGERRRLGLRPRDAPSGPPRPGRRRRAPRVPPPRGGPDAAAPPRRPTARRAHRPPPAPRRPTGAGGAPPGGRVPPHPPVGR
jgi:CheY-like chemotaxis protein